MTVFIFHFNLKDTTTHTCLILNMNYRNYYCWWYQLWVITLPLSFLKKEPFWKKGILSRGLVSEQKEDNHYWKRLLLLMIRIVSSELSFEIAATLPTYGSPQCCQTPLKRYDQSNNWLILDWFICWSFNDPFKRLSPVPWPSLIQTKQKTKVNLSLSLLRLKFELKIWSGYRIFQHADIST